MPPTERTIIIFIWWAPYSTVMSSENSVLRCYSFLKREVLCLWALISWQSRISRTSFCIQIHLWVYAQCPSGWGHLIPSSPSAWSKTREKQRKREKPKQNQSEWFIALIFFCTFDVHLHRVFRITGCGSDYLDSRWKLWDLSPHTSDNELTISVALK